jgi:hypothetical protein
VVERHAFNLDPPFVCSCMRLDSIAPFSRQQHGLVTRAQLVLTLTGRQVDRAVAAGQLEVMSPGVYRLGGAPRSLEQSVLAACLAGGATARASFACAAALWGMDGFHPGPVEITVDRSRRVRLPGVVVHQSAVPDQIVTRGAIPVASVARTLCDLTATKHHKAVERAVDACLRQRLVTIDELHTAYESIAGRGRHRSTVMRTILEWRSPEHHPGESPGEVRVLQLLVAAGLPRPIQQHELRVNDRTIRIDLAYPAVRIAIEFDGWTYHATRSAFDNDRARANELELLGWTVLRFTTKSSDIVIVQTVRAALARAGVISPPHGGAR